MTARRLMPFQDSKIRIERARYLAGTFQTRLEANETEKLAIVLRDFARELRAALDSTIADIAHVRSKDPEGVVFPFADDAKQLSDICDVDFRGIDEDLAAYLKRLRPYKGGHPYLHFLRDLDSVAACDEFIAANRAEVLALTERIFQAATETCGELSARFWARI